MTLEYGRGGGRGINLRIIIALVIAIGGIITYMTRKSVNPVTGETQHVALSASQEIALGLEAAPQMSAQMGGEIPKSDPRAASSIRDRAAAHEELDTTDLPVTHTRAGAVITRTHVSQTKEV